MLPSALTTSTRSGKSTLLTALLGELQPLHLTEPDLGPSQRERSRIAEGLARKLSLSPDPPVPERVSADGGTQVACGHTAYVPQVPWLCHGTIRDNILFGSAYDKSWYEQVGLHMLGRMAMQVVG